MKAKFLGVAAAIALLGLSPARATTYTYNVGFNVDTLSITGTIVTGCDSCTLDPTSGALVSWSFTSSDGTTMASSDQGAYIIAFPVYPLTSTPTAINFDPAGPPGIVQFTDSSAILFFQAAYVDAPAEIHFADNANSYTVIYRINDFTGTAPSAVQIAQIAPTPLPAALPLFATGLGALGLLGWRRKRKVGAVAT